MERYAIHIPVQGAPQLLRCADDGTLSLEAAQEAVKGYIETVSTVLSRSWAKEPCDRIILICNEEGKLQGLEENYAATELVSGGRCLDIIVGDALLVMAKGENIIGFQEGVALNIIKRWELGA